MTRDVWTSLGRPSLSDEAVYQKIKLGLRNENVDKFQAVFQTITDPNSGSFGQWLSHDQLTQMLAPSSETQNKVDEWLDRVGAVNVQMSKSLDWITADVPVRAVEREFETAIHAFHVRAGPAQMDERGDWDLWHTPIFRSAEPGSGVAVPRDLEGAVDLVLGVHDFPPLDDKLLKAHLNPRQQYNGTAPNILQLGGSAGFLVAAIEVFCMDGSISFDGCHSSPPAVMGAYITLNYINGKMDSAFSNLTFAQGNPMFVNTSIIPFIPVDVSVQIVYEGYHYGPIAKFNTTHFPTPLGERSLFQELYDIPKNLKGLASNNSQSFLGFIEQYVNVSALQTINDELGLATDFTLNINGPNNQSTPGGEAMLDAVMLLSVAPGVPTTFWSVPMPHFVLDWAIIAANTSQIPYVISISYGAPEDEVASGLPSNLTASVYIDRTNLEFQKITSRGTTIVVACGDAGASNVGHGSNNCTSSLVPTYPASSPFVLSVGSTFATPYSLPLCFDHPKQMPFNSSAGSLAVHARPHCTSLPLGEVSVSVNYGRPWTTGGGFSDYTQAPDWQTDAVTRYLKYGKYLPPASSFNETGRAYPDISAIGSNIFIADDVGSYSIFTEAGTSASAPLMAAMVSLLNDARMQSGKSSLGFVNRWLYQLLEQSPDAFNDIVVGDNRCGDIGGQDMNGNPTADCCEQGFHASPQWDAVSGLGSPNFRRLRELALQL